jgi:hypothetical protein
VIGWSLRAPSQGGSKRPDPLLGAGKPVLLAPVGEVAAFDVFRFEPTLERGQLAEIVVSYRGPSGEYAELETHTVSAGNEWRPSHAVTDKWPAEINCYVRILDATGDGTGVRSPETIARRMH